MGREEDVPEVPPIIYNHVILSCTAIVYPMLASAELSDEQEIFLNLLGGCCSLLVSLGGTTMTRLVYGNLFTLVLLAVKNRSIRAFVLGAAVGYLQTTCEVYALNLTLKYCKREVVILARTTIAMLACFSFFLLYFFPRVGALAVSWPAALVFPLAQALAAYFFVVETPLEILVRKRQKNHRSLLFGDVYGRLSLLFEDAPFASFHNEYTELIILSEQGHKKMLLKDVLFAVFSKLNLSFLFFGFQAILSTEKNVSVYLVVLPAVQMFCWFLARSFPASHTEMCVMAVASIFLLRACSGAADTLVTALLVCGLQFIPSRQSYLDQSTATVAASEAIKFALSAGLFFFFKEYTVVRKESV